MWRAGCITRNGSPAEAATSPAPTRISFSIRSDDDRMRGGGGAGVAGSSCGCGAPAALHVTAHRQKPPLHRPVREFLLASDLMTIACAAAVVPAWRAARVDVARRLHYT